MACNSIQSSFSSQMIRKYDVFVSFRGDTRNNFTDHLFAALHRKGIVTFRDDTKLKKGEPISLDLLQAIEGSQIFIVVFSKNYASSTWCLRELAKIVDCIEVSGKRVLPVFYDVDPSEVRKRSGNYEKFFLEHEERFKENLDMMVQVQNWRAALTQVANLSGWDVRDKCIVREKSPKEPRKWSRLWEYKDLQNVMLDNMVAENLEAVVLKRDPDKIQEKTMRADALSKMSHLKLLILWNLKLSGCLNCLSNELRYLSWGEYPFMCLPSSFQSDKLVELILPYSSIKQLWEGTKPLHNLRRMDLSLQKSY